MAYLALPDDSSPGFACKQFLNSVELPLNPERLETLAECMVTLQSYIDEHPGVPEDTQLQPIVDRFAQGNHAALMPEEMRAIDTALAVLHNEGKEEQRAILIRDFLAHQRLVQASAAREPRTKGV
jgi:hypothetical protein